MSVSDTLLATALSTQIPTNCRENMTSFTLYPINITYPEQPTYMYLMVMAGTCLKSRCPLNEPIPITSWIPETQRSHQLKAIIHLQSSLAISPVRHPGSARGNVQVAQADNENHMSISF